MEVVPQILSAATAPVTIEDSEVHDRLVDANTSLCVRLQVKHDADPVFVVIATKAIMCVSAVCHQRL